jgi:hypothetical protein
MSKKAKDGKRTKSPLDGSGPTPPPLSEELIAQLQGAVSAARRKRIADGPQPRDSSKS